MKIPIFWIIEIQIVNSSLEKVIWNYIIIYHPLTRHFFSVESIRKIKRFYHPVFPNKIQMVTQYLHFGFFSQSG